MGNYCKNFRISYRKKWKFVVDCKSMDEFLRVSVDSIKAGVTFSEPVFFEDGENMFLPKNEPVKQLHIDVIATWKVPYLLTRGKITSLQSEC